MKLLKFYFLLLSLYSFNSFATKYIAATCPGPVIWGAFDATCPFFSSPGGTRLSFQPATGDVLEIPAGCTVTVNQAFNITNAITFNIYGQLNFSGSSNKLTFDNTATVINVYTGGSINGPSNSNQIRIGPGGAEWSGPGTSTGPFTITNNALPIELLDFSGICINNGVELYWSTATEKDNEYFLIERSINGSEWQNIAKVSGNGTSSIINRYTHIDYFLSNEIVYYRLTQVDRNGASKVFKAIDIDCKSNTKDQMILFPNPTNSELNIRLNASSSVDNISIKVINIIGAVVLESKVDIIKGSNLFTLPVDLSSGTYHIMISSDNMTIPSQKLIIMK